MESLFIALGGNALAGDLAQQYAHTSETMRELAHILLSHPARVVITHGNGPQVGNILFRSEYARKVLYPLTLDVCVSDSEGGMGYMLQQVLHNELINVSVNRNVVTVITQVEVDPDDPAMQNPTKFIGQWYSEKEARRLARERGWIVREDSDRGWRRVVPSPKPIRIVEADVISTLLDTGVIVIAAGGGGIPITRARDGSLYGIEAVIDKDLAAALLASTLGIRNLVIVTGVEKVYLNYTSPERVPLDRLSISEARRYLAEGHFPAGSMGPKIEAAIRFIESGGRRTIITSPGCILQAIKGNAGTTITPGVQDLIPNI